jgi:hypothetical protein
VTQDSLALHAIARRMRARRFANGALRLDNTRLYFTLDAAGQPVAAAPYVQQVGRRLRVRVRVRVRAVGRRLRVRVRAVGRRAPSPPPRAALLLSAMPLSVKMFTSHNSCFGSQHTLLNRRFKPALHCLLTSHHAYVVCSVRTQAGMKKAMVLMSAPPD